MAASAGNADLASFRGRILEKRIAHKVLQKGGHFRCRNLHEDVLDEPVSYVTLPECHSARRIDNHEDIKDLPDGVYGWPGSGNWHFAGIDAVVQPHTLYQITVSERHGINTHGLATAASYLRAGAQNARLVFAVPPDAFSHSMSRQRPKAIRGRSDLKALAESVEQFVLEIPVQAWAAAKDGSAMER